MRKKVTTKRTNLTERIMPYITKSNKKWLSKKAKEDKRSVSAIVNSLLTDARTC